MPAFSSIDTVPNFPSKKWLAQSSAKQCAYLYIFCQRSSSTLGKSTQIYRENLNSHKHQWIHPLSPQPFEGMLDFFFQYHP